MLNYVLRIRDLVHGTILFTRQEMAVINHPFFQRLRQVRQNDVAFYVYPSMNTSRFEHILGVCRIAGMMAENLTNSPQWNDYAKELKREAGISLKEDFIRLCRFYALLHDIGHLPLSHLFEYALESYTEPNYTRTIKEWTGFEGFEKLHEAFGAGITRRIVTDVRIPKRIADILIRLMEEKHFPFENPLSIPKRVIDSGIDADRIDFVQRDGLIAGGEYGHYDTRRLCDSVFIARDESGWLIGYSEKAITSMEALLLDRYRIYEWVHFHHRVIAMKMLVKFLIAEAFKQGLISREAFNPDNVEEFTLRDDVWLWNVLRSIKSENKFIKMAQQAVFLREKRNILNLWKTRPAYHLMNRTLAKKTRRDYPLKDYDRSAIYQIHISSVGAIDMPTLTFDVRFTPVADDAIYLYSESEEKLTGETLFSVSELVSHLNAIWKNEPQYFVLLIGENMRSKTKSTKQKWLDHTADWIVQGRLW